MESAFTAPNCLLDSYRVNGTMKGYEKYLEVSNEWRSQYTIVSEELAGGILDNYLIIDYKKNEMRKNGVTENQRG